MLTGCLASDSAGPLDWSALDSADAASMLAPEAGSEAGDGSIVAAAADAQAVETSAADATLVPNAFEGAPPFVSQPVVVSAKQQMAETGNVPTKTACLACHNGASTAPSWLAGGTVFRDVGGTLPAVDSEVRIVDTGSGRAFSAHSDSDGNFWLPMPMESAGGPFLIGVRNPEAEKWMPLLQRGLDCNGSACHGGAQGPIHLP